MLAWHREPLAQVCCLTVCAEVCCASSPGPTRIVINAGVHRAERLAQRLFRPGRMIAGRSLIPSINAVIQVRMRLADIERTRFVYAPLGEVAESLYMLASGKIPSVHQPWFDLVRSSLEDLDLELLTGLVPARPMMADILFDGPSGPDTSFEAQLEYLREQPADLLHEQLNRVWRGDLPPAIGELVTEGRRGMHRLAETLGQYWSVAMESHWAGIRRMLDEDISNRASDLAKGGIELVLAALHPSSPEGETVHVSSRRVVQHALAGVDLLLTPSVFAWPNVVFSFGGQRVPRLTYAARGAGSVWGLPPSPDTTDDEALSALVGRSRAAILRSLESAYSTTELAVILGQSKPAVSQHLSVLRRSGLVKSWRSGRSVMYRRTSLATTVIESHRGAGEVTHEGED